MPHRVLPACGRVLEVGEVGQDPIVDVLHGQLLLRGLLHRHKNQAAEGVGGLGVHMFMGVVRHMRRVSLRYKTPSSPTLTGFLPVTVFFLVLPDDQVVLPGVDVLQQVRVLQPGEGRELIVLDGTLLQTDLAEAAGAEPVRGGQVLVVRIQRHGVHGVEDAGQGAAGEALAQAGEESLAHGGVALPVEEPIAEAVEGAAAVAVGVGLHLAPDLTQAMEHVPIHSVLAVAVHLFQLDIFGGDQHVILRGIVSLHGRVTRICAVQRNLQTVHWHYSVRGGGGAVSARAGRVCDTVW